LDNPDRGFARIVGPLRLGGPGSPPRAPRPRRRTPLLARCAPAKQPEKTCIKQRPQREDLGHLCDRCVLRVKTSRLFRPLQHPHYRHTEPRRSSRNRGVPQRNAVGLRPASLGHSVQALTASGPSRIRPSSRRTRSSIAR
jgi:hypothetical protein